MVIGITPSSACAKAAKGAHKVEGGHRGQPLKPLSRVRDELEFSLQRIDGHVGAISLIFDHLTLYGT